MNDNPPANGSRGSDPYRTLRLVALIAAIAGVILLAALAFVLSYGGIHALARQAGMSASMARLFPIIFDAMLVVSCVAVLLLRGAGWWRRGYAWLITLVLLAAVAAGDAVHAAGTHLPRRPAAITAAVLPWVLLLLAFSLLLSMLRQYRHHRAALARQQAVSQVAAGLDPAVTLTGSTPRRRTGLDLMPCSAGTGPRQQPARAPAPPTPPSPAAPGMPVARRPPAARPRPGQARRTMAGPMRGPPLRNPLLRNPRSPPSPPSRSRSLRPEPPSQPPRRWTPWTSRRPMPSPAPQPLVRPQPQPLRGSRPVPARRPADEASAAGQFPPAPDPQPATAARDTLDPQPASAAQGTQSAAAAQATTPPATPDQPASLAPAATPPASGAPATQEPAGKPAADHSPATRAPAGETPATDTPADQPATTQPPAAEEVTGRAAKRSRGRPMRQRWPPRRPPR